MKKLSTLLLSTTLLTSLIGQVHAETVNVKAEAVTYADLTDAQKAQIQKGNVSFALKDGIPCVYIVYTNGQTVEVPLLPNTGSLQATALMGVGMGVLGFAGYLAFKNRKSDKTMLVALAGVSSLLLAGQVDASNRVIETHEYTATVENGIVTIVPKAIEGYEYVGYFLDDCLPTGPTGVVTVSSMPEGNANDVTTTPVSSLETGLTEVTTTPAPTETELTDVTTTPAPAETTTPTTDVSTTTTIATTTPTTDVSTTTTIATTTPTTDVSTTTTIATTTPTTATTSTTEKPVELGAVSLLALLPGVGLLVEPFKKRKK